MAPVDRIFQLRDENNLTSKELEVKVGLANSSLSQWKRGKGSPSLNNIIKLARYFQVSSDYLLCLSDERNPFFDRIEISLSEDERLLLSIFREVGMSEKFRIIQVCMNERDASEQKRLKRQT